MNGISTVDAASEWTRHMVLSTDVKSFSAATRERESSFFNKHSEASKMSHRAVAIDWIDNPFQNLHPRLFNKQRKVANKRKKESGTSSQSLSPELNLTQGRFSSLVKAEHWSRGEMKRANSVKHRDRLAEEHDDGLTLSSGRSIKETPRDQPFFFPPLDMRPCTEKPALRRHNSSGVLAATQRGNYTAALSKRYSFQERRIDRTLKNQLNRLDSQESLLSAYSSCLSLNQDVKAAKAPKANSFKGYSSPFGIVGTRASNLSSDDFCDHVTGNHCKNPRHYLMSSSPTLVKRQANTSQRELKGEVIVKPRLHRSYSAHRKWCQGRVPNDSMMAKGISDMFCPSKPY